MTNEQELLERIERAQLRRRIEERMKATAGAAREVAADVGTQAVRGLARFGASTVRRIGNMDQAARDTHAELERSFGHDVTAGESPLRRFGQYLQGNVDHAEPALQPTTMAGAATSVAVPIATEGLLYAGGGGAIRSAAGLAGRAAPAGGRFLSRLGAGTRAAAADAAAVAPLDVATALTPEDTAAHGLGEVLGTDRGRALASRVGLPDTTPETLQEWARDPAKAAAFETLFGFGADLLLRGAVGGARALPRSSTIGETVGAGITEGVAPVPQTWSPPRTTAPEVPGYVRSSTGSYDFGEVDAERALRMRREAAPIRLTEERAAHIGQKHADEIRALGYERIEDFVEDISTGWVDAYPSGGGSLTLVKFNDPDRVLYVTLRPEPGGPHYSVGSAHPVRSGRFVREEGLLGGLGRRGPDGEGPSADPYSRSPDVPARGSDPTDAGSTLTDSQQPRPNDTPDGPDRSRRRR